jgi:hypothetical protein
MRGWAMVAACALVLAAIPVLAQRGGGHSSGGHGGFAGHASGGGGHFGGMRSAPGMSRGFVGPRQPSSRQSFSHQSFAHQPSFGGHGFSGNRRGSRFRSFGYRNRYGYGYPWGYAGFYDPYWWWDSGSSYDEDRAREIDLANQMNEQNLEEQQMREQGDRDIYARPAPRQGQTTAASAEVVPPTVLVFRDQRKQEVQNYAIVGQTLWNFSAQRTQKIPLSDLDLAATTKANDERGVDFRIPNSPEGQ